MIYNSIRKSFLLCLAQLFVFELNSDLFEFKIRPKNS